MQLRLFHPVSFEGHAIEGDQIVMEKRPTHWGALYNWRCMRCGQRGVCYSHPRQDLLKAAYGYHKCKIVEADYVAALEAQA